MAKKKKKENEEQAYTCPCGSSSFINEGLANYRDEVTISIGKNGQIIHGSAPELDMITSKLKCAQCGAEVE